jgi:hypothetical protein
MAQWESPEGSLPMDDRNLARLSGLFTRWSEFKDEILENFTRVRNRYVNHVQRAEWSRARNISEFRGHKSPPSGILRPSEASQNSTHRTHARGRTETETSTKTEEQEQKQKPSRAVRTRGETKHSSDPRHVACKAEIFAYFQAKNSADPDWNGREGKALGMLLGANPKLTAEGVHRLLEQRARSDVNHAERPGTWIESLGSYRAGPLDRFGKPLMRNTNGGNGHYETRNERITRETIEKLDREEAAGACQPQGSAGA